MNRIRPKVLLIEDHDLSRKMAMAALTNVGCDVDIAKTAQGSIELARKNKYNFILVDLGLPGEDGFSVTSTILKDTLNHQTAIIALTSHKESYYRDKYHMVGMKDFLVKPLTRVMAKSLVDRYVYGLEPINENE